MSRSPEAIARNRERQRERYLELHPDARPHVEPPSAEELARDSAADLAARLGVHPRTITTWRKRAGIRGSARPGRPRKKDSGKVS